MGFIGNLFGGGGGNTGGAGMNYSATGASPAQIGTAWNNTQSALAQQQDFINALAANQNQAIGSQGFLNQLLQQQSLGYGPNPAQAQYQQNVNDIAAQQAGAIASQKGINPALAARLIAQQGGAAKQQAAGQQATLAAQQQLGAQSNLANLSAQQLGQQQNAMNAFQQGALSQQGNLYGIQGSANAANAGVAGVTARQQGGLFGGLLSGVGSAIGLAHGGEVPYAAGGAVEVSDFAKSLAKSGYAMGGRVPIDGEKYAHQMKPVPGKANVNGDSLKNDIVPAKLSPGEVVIPRSVMQAKDPPTEAAKFVAAVMAKKRGLLK